MYAVIVDVVTTIDWLTFALWTTFNTTVPAVPVAAVVPDGATVDGAVVAADDAGFEELPQAAPRTATSATGIKKRRMSRPSPRHNTNDYLAPNDLIQDRVRNVLPALP
jgi:hypothetical protein